MRDYRVRQPGPPSVCASGISVRSPSANVCRSDNGRVVKAKPAGVRDEDLGLPLAGRDRGLCGRRGDVSGDDAPWTSSMTVAHHRFARTARFPTSLQGVGLRPEHRDGTVNMQLTHS